MLCRNVYATSPGDILDTFLNHCIAYCTIINDLLVRKKRHFKPVGQLSQCRNVNIARVVRGGGEELQHRVLRARGMKTALIVQLLDRLAL